MSATYNDESKVLAVYGSLQPGGPNHYLLENIPGNWSSGIVRGHLEESGWGAKIGFPGLHLSDQGDEIEVKLFESENISDLLKQLERFPSNSNVCKLDDSFCIGQLFQISGYRAKGHPISRIDCVSHDPAWQHSGWG